MARPSIDVNPGVPDRPIPITDEVASLVDRAARFLPGSTARGGRGGTFDVVSRGDDWPPGVFTYFGTADANDEPSETFEQRAQRCYELAGFALAFGTAPETSTLVHGTQHGPDARERIGHAWLVLPDASLLWEPVTACIYDRAAWIEFAKIRDEVAYTLPLLRRLLLRHRHYGRFHESRYP